jgi:hypothetical protein
MQFTALSLTLLATVATAFPTNTPSLSRRDSNVTCSESTPAGIYEPANGATLSQYITDSSCNNFTIFYCSDQYDKTASLTASVWLTDNNGGYDITSGTLLAQGVEPDNQDSVAGWYSYRFNVSICPMDGTYRTGDFALSVYETMTGKFVLENCGIV